MKPMIPLTLMVAFFFSVPLVGSDETAEKPQTAARKKPAKTVIPVFRLSGTVTEKPVPETLPFFSGGLERESLKSLLKRLEQVKHADAGGFAGVAAHHSSRDR